MSNGKPSPTELIQSVDGAISRVRTRAVDVSFNELFDMYKSKELIINPEFQRLFRWSTGKQSQFVESLILELPIPPIYVIEVEDGVYELIDGLQRISAYLHFRGMHPQEPEAGRFLVLSECDVLPALNGLTYDDLPQAIQIKLKRHFIRMEVLRRESDKRMRYHMFKRLNTGGELLSPQEVRNCTIRLLDNTFNEFLKTVSKNTDFETCMAQLTEEKREQMYMEEYALRFFAIKNNQAEYVKEIGDFLTEYMEAVSDPEKAVGFDYAREEEAFKTTFRVLNEALGESTFSGVNKQGTAMGYFSSLHFEALAIGIQKHLVKLASADLALKEKVRDALLELKRDPTFQRLTKGGGKNYAAALRAAHRFRRAAGGRVPGVDLAELRAEMEIEREWREREMRLLRNQLALLASEDQRMTARKAMVVMLYAHFEGVCKALLSMYVNRLNGLALRVADVAPALGAASLAEVFQALRDPNRKCAEFARALPNDTSLHRFARDRDFVEAAWKVAERAVQIDPDNVVDTESNLKPVVLRKMLYRLGLDPELAQPWEGAIHNLLNRRNAVAHGTAKAGLTEKEYGGLEQTVGLVVDGLVKAISDAVAGQVYLAAVAPPFGAATGPLVAAGEGAGGAT